MTEILYNLQIGDDPEYCMRLAAVCLDQAGELVEKDNARLGQQLKKQAADTQRQVSDVINRHKGQHVDERA